MHSFSRALALFALLAALVVLSCTTDGEDPASASPTEATSAPTEAPGTSTQLGTETATTTPSPTATQQRNFVGDFGDYPFVVLVEEATADLLDSTPPDPVLTFEEVGTPTEALDRIEAIDAAGLILDATTYADFPIGDLAALYDDGRVMVAFDVVLDSLQLSLDGGERVDAAGTPGVGGLPEPYFSIVHRVREGVSPETGQARSAAFFPELLHSRLAQAADIAAGRIRP